MYVCIQYTMDNKYAVFASVLLCINACLTQSDDIRILSQKERLDESSGAFNIPDNFSDTGEQMNLDTLERNKQEPIHLDLLEQNYQEVVNGLFHQGNETEAPSNKRSRRQTGPAASLITSIAQKCDSIVLAWRSPNIPYSSSYHSENAQFKYYNIYRQTRHFTSVAGLVPIASGKNILELRDANTQKWIDRDPPVGTFFYAVSYVNYKGKEAKDVLSQQITFFGAVDKASIPAFPTSIIPPALKGDVLHQSMAYNPNRNEYMIAFDVDINKDDLPDHLYAVRVSPIGAIVDGYMMNITFEGSNLLGYPSVAFNPNTRQYLIASQLRIHTDFQGKSVIAGVFSLANETKQHGRPVMILKSSVDGVNVVNSMRPKLVYNPGTGGFVMSALVETTPALPLAFAVFMKADVTVTSFKPMYKGEALDVIPVIDTKNQHVHFVFQVPQYLTKVINSKLSAKDKNKAYLIGTIKANATGSWINTNSQQTPRNVVGFSSDKNAGIDAYFNPTTQWLTIFWNNRIRGKRVISSAEIRAMPESYLRKSKDLTCGIKQERYNPSSCYLPENNGNVLLWQYGNKIGGYGLKDRTFKPVRGKQNSPRMIYNPRSRQIFVTWLQYSAGRTEIFVRNIIPSTRAVTCTPACAIEEKCSMHDNCVRQTQAAPNILSSCTVKNGGCSHMCVKDFRGRKCSCPATFSLGLNKMKCFPKGSKPDISLLYSSEGSIWSASFYDKQKRVSFQKIPITGKRIVAFVYNKKDKYLYWGDSQKKKICRALLNGKKKETLVRTQVELPDGMIVDPDADHLYWTDSVLGVIFRSELDGSKKIPFVDNLVQPKTLALHRKKGWLYWTTWGDTGLIERINTDGTKRKGIVSTDLRRPNGLAIAGSRLYWVDSFHGSIEMSNLEGQRRMSYIRSSILHPFGIIVQRDRVMWTDWTGNIFSMDERKLSEVEPVVRGITKPCALQIYDDQSIPQDEKQEREKERRAREDRRRKKEDERRAREDERRSREDERRAKGNRRRTRGRFCSDPGKPSNGDRNPKPNKDGGYVVGARVAFTCNRGFKRVGYKRQRCLGNNRWTGVTASCVGNVCSDPGTPLNGDRSPKPNKDGKYVVGARVAFTCNPGFKRLGDKQRQCLANNRWTGVTASCVEKFCSDPGTPLNGDRNPKPNKDGEYVVGTRIVFTCNAGFKRFGEKRQRCLANNRWTGVTARCVGQFCSDPGTPLYGDRNPRPNTDGKYVVGAKVVFTCNPGYKHLGDRQQRCLPNNRWTGVTASCVGEFCSDPGIPLYGDRNPKPNKDGKYVVGARVVFTCNPGFKHLGDRQQRCLPNNRWTGVTPNCVALPVFTSVVRNESKKLGDSIVLHCSVGKVKGVKIHWLKDGKYLYDTKRQQHVGENYPIAKLATSDSGTYSCVAVNLAGEVRASMYLDVVTHVIQDCGLPKLHILARIHGGVQAKEGSIPWQALLLYKSPGKRKVRALCGGTLLNSRWVVTAAHCFSGLRWKDVSVRLGAHNRKDVKPYEQHIRIANLYTHPRFNRQTFDSDIALIKLTKRAVMNQYIQPTCLPVKDDVKMGVVGKISGWGTTVTTGKMVNILRAVDVDVVNHTTCVKSNRYTVTKNMFCAGHPTGKDACRGDSGGPLTVKDKATGRAVLHGIVSWGEGCGQKGKYGVYTKIYNYLPWFRHLKVI